MKLDEQLSIKQRQIDLARATLNESYADFRQVLHRRLSSRTALALGFGSGVALGWLKRRRREPRVELPARAREAMPKHWFGHYIVWPFLLATARDWVVQHRPNLTDAQREPRD